MIAAVEEILRIHHEQYVRALQTAKLVKKAGNEECWLRQPFSNSHEPCF
jgi:hypothetical protein